MQYKRRYKDQLHQNSYENACDCLYFGMSSKDWEDCGIPKEDRKEVWHTAWEDLANSDM